MRTPRSVHILSALTALATLAACSTYGRRELRSEPTTEYSAMLVWDSGPIDQDYQHQRADLDARHAQENSSPRDGESNDQRAQRHDSERKDLDSRYAQGKASHARAVPSGDGHEDRPHS